MSKKNVKVNEFRYATIEEATVANVLYEYHPVCRRGYIKDGDELVAVRVSHVSVNLMTHEVCSVLTDANGKEYTRIGLYELYHTRSDFESGALWDTNKFHAADVIGMISSKYALRPINVKIDESGLVYLYYSTWVFKNGEAVDVPVGIYEISDGTNSSWEITKGDIPEKCWKDRDSVYRDNEYTFIDEDGESFVQRGVNLRLKPTKKQNAILEKLRAAFQEAKDAGLKFVWDRDDCSSVKAYNASEVYNYGYEIESDGGDIVPISNIDLTDTGITFYDYCGCDSCERIELNMTPYQKKIYNKRKSESAE